MHLLNNTLQKATAITQAITGSFSGPKSQDILISRGKILELWKQEENSTKMKVVLSSEVFGLIRSISSFRVTGFQKDYIAIGSDSGRLVILEYDEKKNQFIKVHQETFGKTGCRRIVPGEYLAVDPKGRAIMIGAIEKQKFVYVLNRDTSNRLTISSPLEAHSSNTVIYSMVGIDVGYESPMFACLELDHTESDETSEELDSVSKKVLTFYELDLSSNHVVKKISKEVEKSSYHLISVPGGNDGPGGVLICSSDKITYRNSGQKDISTIVPRRLRKDDDYSNGNMIIASSTIKRKQIIFFIQNEEGDLFKLNLDHKSNQVSKINIFYFDTIPIAISICILIKSASIFVASEFGDHKIYQFKSLGQDENNFVSKVEISKKLTIPLFNIHKNLKNLQLKENINSLSPIIDAKVIDLKNNQTPNIYTICGRSENSTLRILKHGLPIEQFASVKLPGVPINVWTVKKSMKEEFDNYIVLSFSSRTMVFSIGKEVAQVTDSGFETLSSTLSVSLLGKDSILQIHPTGLRQIKQQLNGENKTIEWSSKKTIIRAAANESQVVAALSGGEIIYFELNQQGILVEVERKDMGQDIACLSIGSVPEGRIRNRFLAVGLYDKTVRIFSLDTEDCLQVLTRQAIPAEPESITITEMLNSSSSSKELNLYIGLNNGVLIKNVMDSLTGELFDTRARFLGSKPLRLVNVKTQKSNSVLVLSSRSWLCYFYQNKFQMTPLSYEPLQSASNFSSEQCSEGLVAVTGNTLVVFSIKKLGEVFNQQIFPLKYTPRKFIFHPKTKNMIILETDHNAYKLSELENFKQEQMEIEEENEQDSEFEKLRPNKNGKWASYIRLIDTNSINEKSNEDTITTQYLELKNNEAAFNLTTCEFSDKETYLIVGIAKDLQLYPSKNSGGCLNVYKFDKDGKKIELLHQTELEDVPTALCEFQGRLLVGMGKFLRVYDLGKKKLLKKSENKSFPNKIISISHNGKRIYVGDIAESFHYVKFKEDEQFLSIFADSTVPRWLTASTQIDYSTMAGSDKFGNVFISRLPEDINDSIEDDPTSNRFMWERGFLGGAPQKAKEIVSFHLGETVTSLCKANFVPGSPGVLLYFTIFGTIGCLVPFSSKEDVDFFSLLEMHLRQDGTSLVGRDHLSFVSYYFPVKNCVDGDLLDTYEKMSIEKQKSIADELDRTPSEIKKKLQDVRNLTGF